MSEFTPGVCRYCKCTEEMPCMLSSGDTCGWEHGTDRTVCTAPHCISNYWRDKRAKEREFKALTRRHSTGEICELQQKEIRQRKRESRIRCKARREREFKAQKEQAHVSKGEN
jgi:hypothetical protein